MIFSNKQARRDKEFLRLEREYNRLRRAQWNAPLVRVERPYPSGWVKMYGLRDDFTRRNDAYVFRRILGAVNQRVFSRNRSFVAKDGKAIALRPKIILEREWPKLGWPENYKKHFLFGHWRLSDSPRARLVKGYKLAHEWMLEEKIEPFVVTQVQADLPETRRRIVEISTALNCRSGWRRLSRLHGLSMRGYWRDGEALWRLKLSDHPGPEIEES